MADTGPCELNGHAWEYTHGPDDSSFDDEEMYTCTVCGSVKWFS